MDSPSASDPSDKTQCFISDGLFRAIAGLLEDVKEFVLGDSVLLTDDPRPDVAVLARLLVAGPIFMLLCCLFWILIVLSGVEFVIRVCASAVIEIPKLMVWGFLLIGRLCRDSCRVVTGRRSTLDSTQPHPLWDRWLDG
jgi:hypothetical protein